MGTSVYAQLGKNNDYVNAVVRISDLIWKYERSHPLYPSDLALIQDSPGCGSSQFGTFLD